MFEIRNMGIIQHCGIVHVFPHGLTLKALSPDENEISLYVNTTCLNTQVTRIKEVITEYRMS